MKKHIPEQQYLFSEEEINNIKQLGLLLRKINHRLKSEEGIDIIAEARKQGIHKTTPWWLGE